MKSLFNTIENNISSVYLRCFDSSNEASSRLKIFKGGFYALLLLSNTKKASSYIV